MGTLDTIRADASLVKALKQHVLNKHGKIHGYLVEETEQALKAHLAAEGVVVE